MFVKTELVLIICLAKQMNVERRVGLGVETRCLSESPSVICFTAEVGHE